MARAKAQSVKQSLYSVHPGVAMVQKWIADLPTKTGKTLDQWIGALRSEAPPDEKGRRAWLKDRGVGTNVASWLAERAGGGDTGIAEEDPDAYLEAAAR